MVDECASCEVDDELLFTCSYCEKQFCATHQFPHHGCEGFGRAAEAVDADWLPASALEGEAVETWEVESTAGASDATGARTAARTAPGATETMGTDSTELADVDGEAAEPATVSPARPSRRAESLSNGSWASENRPPRGTGDSVVNVRPMDSRQVVGGTEANAAPRTVGDWISRQTYLTLMLKVGIVALLVNSAFYGGMAVTMYSLFPFAL